MVSEIRAGLRALALVALGMLACGCYPSHPAAAGRPCARGGGCGPGAHCDCATKTCVAGEAAVEKACTTELAFKIAGKDYWIDLPAMCTVPCGVFLMGSPESDPCRAADVQETQHEVTITRPFQIGEHEVTQDDFNRTVYHNPSVHDGCLQCPVEMVSWHEAVEYCNALSGAEGITQCYEVTRGNGCDKGCPPGWACVGNKQCAHAAVKPEYAGAEITNCPSYRLPTEAEWEYAYRAGTTTPLYSGTITRCDDSDPAADQIAWYGVPTGLSTTVGSKQPNSWGLLDMAGNVAEWCHDGYVADLGAAPVTDPVAVSDAERVVRGGSYYEGPRRLRAASRARLAPNGAAAIIGFRCALTLWSCNQGAACQKQCKNDPPCLNRCERHMCASGVSLLKAATDCVMQKCLMFCISGFNTECMKCVDDECREPWSACESHRC